MEFTVNGTEYWLEECDMGKWLWSSHKDESDFFDSPWEAQQDAIRNEQERLKVLVDDGYWGAYHQFFDRRDYQ